MVNLRTQTIARRRSYLDSSAVSNPASDTINIHPLVHEILRAIHRQLAPADRMLDLVTMLMACAYGWIITLRREGAFFPLEQLLVHGQWILDLVETVVVPDNSDEHQIYVFRCAKFYLSCEIANTVASQGCYERSVGLLQKALDDVDAIELTPHAQGMAAKAACDVLADAALGRLNVGRASNFARRALIELRKFSASGNPQIGGVVATLAIQAAQSVRTFDGRGMEEIAAKFTEIASRQTVTATPQVASVMQIEQLLKTGHHSQALALVRQVREPNASVYDRVMFDNFEVIAQLHLGHFTQASDGVDRILSVANSGRHLNDHLMFACRDIGTALDATQHSWTGMSTRLPAQQLDLQRLHATLAR
jgi:hypothetical protein